MSALTELLDSEYYRNPRYMKKDFAPGSFMFQWAFGRAVVRQVDYNEIDLSYTWNGKQDLVSIRFLDFGLPTLYENVVASLDYFLKTCEGAKTITREEINFFHDVIHLTKETEPWILTYMYHYEGPYFKPVNADKKYFKYDGRHYFRKINENVEMMKNVAPETYTTFYTTEGASSQLQYLITHGWYVPNESPYLALPQSLVDTFQKTEEK